MQSSMPEYELSSLFVLKICAENNYPLGVHWVSPFNQRGGCPFPVAACH